MLPITIYVNNRLLFTEIASDYGYDIIVNEENTLAVIGDTIMGMFSAKRNIITQRNSYHGFINVRS